MLGWALPAFVVGAVVSLVASARLVRALEEVGTRLGLTEVLVGLLAALAADAPELTSALAAELEGKHEVGVGVLFGSNVFNIAALLGLGSLVAGRVALHRRVVVLEGVAALGIAGSGLVLVTGTLAPAGAALVSMAVLVPYLAVSAVPASRLPLPRAAQRWLSKTVKEESEEVSLAEPALPGPGLGASASTALVALVCVVVASAVMERAASAGGPELGIPEVVVGAVVLAGVTSLPNAVAAVYLARQGKGAAMFSEALNSNTINVVGGLMVPSALGGIALGPLGRGSLFTGAAYAGMTVLAAGFALAGRGVGRAAAGVLVAAYAGFLVTLLTIA